ncbi:hypothetical protein M8J77_006038 [Diaphorina citri]|nr:hypothetical protein M8J77_006038 [Diaphorina citri]
MPTNKPPGPDGIPPLIYSQCVDQIKIPLTIIINLALKTKQFPSLLKESIVTPVPKKSGEQDVSGHRPISNLNVAAKIFEGVLYDKMSSFIFNNISPQQHGFVNHKSTVSNLVEFCDFTARAISQHGQVHTVYTDVEKCFDRLCHDAILDKLIKVGFSIPLTQLFASYLKNRKIYVKYLNKRSNPITPSSGIVQGSKLSSLLFILTYDDLHRLIRHSQVLLYADDLKIFKIIRNTEDCEHLQEDLTSISAWLSTIGLNFHPNKCYVMNFTSSKTPITYTYNINNTPLNYVEFYKDLGVTFEKNLDFKKHLEATQKKAFQRLGMIIRFSRPIQDLDALKLLYQSLVRSILEYGSIVWSPRTQVDIKFLEKIQGRFTRYAFNKENKFYPLYPNYIEYDLLIDHFGLSSLKDRRDKMQLKFIENVGVEDDSKGPEIMRSEFDKALKELTEKKAAGIDDIPAELLKNMGEEYEEKLNKIIKECYNTGTLPPDFIKNLEKAFDKIDWKLLFTTLKNKGVDWRDRRIIFNLYKTQTTQIDVNGVMEEAKIRKGVRQGCPLSPYMFNLFIEMSIDTMKNQTRGVKTNGQPIHCIRFADDIVILAETEEDMNEMLNVLSNALQIFKLKINAGKTKTMIVSKTTLDIAANIKLGNVQIQQVQEFCYLGSTIKTNNKSTPDIKKRVALAKQAFQNKYQLLTSRHLSINTRKNFIKTFVWTVLTYGSETWTITKKDREKLEAAEIWMWRKMNKTSWVEKKSNERVLAEVKERRYLMNFIASRKTKLIGHIIRHNDFLSNIFEGKVEGKKPRGRPRMPYFHDIQETMGCSSFESLKCAARDRDE